MTSLNRDGLLSHAHTPIHCRLIGLVKRSVTVFKNSISRVRVNADENQRHSIRKLNLDIDLNASPQDSCMAKGVERTAIPLTEFLSSVAHVVSALCGDHKPCTHRASEKATVGVRVTHQCYCTQTN